MLKLTKWIYVAIPCGPYLSHEAFCGIFHLDLGGWKVEPFIRVSPTWPLFEINRREYDNNDTMLPQHYALLLVCGSWPQLDKCSFSSYPLMAKYVELMGKEKGYKSSHVYCRTKGWSKKELRKLSRWFWKEFLKWYDGVGENGFTSKRIFEVEVFFSPLKILTSPFI
jgi:hypothetical protein